MHLQTLLPLLLLLLHLPTTRSTPGQTTLLGIVGPDYILLGADTSLSSSIALTSSSIDKISILIDPLSHYSLSNHPQEQQTIIASYAGDLADANYLHSILSAHATIREFETSTGCDVECVFRGSKEVEVCNAGLDAVGIANLARGEISSSLRSRGGPLRVCLLIAGMVRTEPSYDDEEEEEEEELPFANRIQRQISMVYPTNTPPLPNKISSPKTKYRQLTPRLIWLDEYGSLQTLKYGAHGFASNFALSILDQGYRPNLTREDALRLMKDCFDQLRMRFVLNCPEDPVIKCVDGDGCRVMMGLGEGSDE